MMEMVSSAVVQETVSQILSGLVHGFEGKEKLDANENLERLEMAHIKLEAALETSDKWLITDASLLRWRKKLKRAAQECDDTLHKYKQGIIEDELMEQEVRNSSLPKQIVHATKSFISSVFYRNNNQLSRSIVRRFEWFADGASEFLRFIELGGTPYRHMPFGSLIKHLFAGKELQHKIVQGNEYPLFVLWLVPFRAEHGIEAGLIFTRKDGNAPEDNFFLSVVLQLSESTDIVGIVIKCLQLFPPHFKSTVEIIKKELTQLTTQDFSWVPYVDSCQKKHWDNVHSFSSQWFRPNPLCCKQHDQHKFCHGSKFDKSGLPDVSLEPVIEVNLQCQVSLSECKSYLQDSPRLKAGLVFTPHGSSNDLLPANKSSPIAAIYSEEQHCLHTDITLEQLEEIMLPKAIDYFRQNAEATVYQMLWKSKHGTAYIQVEKGSIFVPSTQRTFPGARKRKLLQGQDEELWSWAHVIAHFISLWATYAPIRLQGRIMDWIQKEKEMQLSPPPLRLKF
ncbi:uncharacterized protein LOC133892526 [Phragmites australis]|uniref:uncharacterized protein LOC133892526 n=1 Tax=Phragmites australis TaxID=29695 RepID=UPI002D77752B|nr:uncharacterized protein LOC133892526 [Phragmites australis]